MKIRTVWLMVTKFQQELYGRSLILKVTELHYLTFNLKKKIFLTIICFRTKKGSQIQIRLFDAFVNVHYVNLKPLSFDVIGLFAKNVGIH